MITYVAAIARARYSNSRSHIGAWGACEYTRMVEMFFHLKFRCLGYKQNSIGEKFVQPMTKEFNPLGKKNINMSTKTLGWLVRARDGKKLGSGWDPVNSIPTLSQPGPFQSFAHRHAYGACNNFHVWSGDKLPLFL